MEKQGQKNPCSSTGNTCIKHDANMLETTDLTNKKKKDKLSALWRVHKVCLSLKREENNLFSLISDTIDLIACLYEHKGSNRRIHMIL